MSSSVSGRNEKLWGWLTGIVYCVITGDLYETASSAFTYCTDTDLVLLWGGPVCTLFLIIFLSSYLPLHIAV